MFPISTLFIDPKIAPVFYGPTLTLRTEGQYGNTQLEIINLSSTPLSTEIDVLRLGLTFHPSSDTDKSSIIKDVHLFARRLMCRVIFDSPNEASSTCFNTSDYSVAESQAIIELMDLWEEVNTEGDVPFCSPSESDVIPGVTFPPRSLSNLNHNLFRF